MTTSPLSSSSDFPSTSCQPLPSPLPYCSSSKQSMLLHFGEREFVLFYFWKTGSAMGMFGSCILVILICVLSEFIELLRNSMATERARELADNISQNSTVSESIRVSGTHELLRKLRRCFNGYRVSQAILYGLHVIFGHVLVLIIVSFNGWLLVAVAFGKAIGYFIFKGSPIVERTIALESSSPQPIRRHLSPPSPSTAYAKSIHSHISNINES